MIDSSKVTRVEVIDHTKPAKYGGGRAYIFRREDVKVEVVLQDDGNTLKVFIGNKS